MSTTTDTTTADTTATTWALTPEEFTATQAKAEKINARAAKRGFTGRITITGTERAISETDQAGLERTRIVIDTEISGEAPSYGGWMFLAAVDAVPTESGPQFVVRTPPGVDADDLDRSVLVVGHCAHCRTTRANRRYTYLVQHEDTGETMQVGSTCIRDFTGWESRPVFIDTDEVAEKLGGSLAGGGQPVYSPETVVAVAWAATRARGWQAGGGTRSDVSTYLYDPLHQDKKLREDIAAHLGQEATAAASTIIRELLDGLDDEGGYVQNLKTCLRSTHVQVKHLGIVVSAIAAHNRMTTRREEAQKAEQAPRITRYAGEVGQKLTVTRAIAVEQHFGHYPNTSMLIIVEDGPAVAKMFTTAAWAFDVQQGDEVTVTGTVKAHEEYQGDEQTVLTRPKRTMKD